jgi:hypothetical protein
MKVKDLIKELGKIDQNLEIYGYSEDESIATAKKPFRFFVVDSVSINPAILSRDSDGSPQAKFDDGPGSQKLALITMVADF